jgi:nitrite reductase/ring-hydroxylating ferredoxin subunit/uncharacterized membrane protein
MEPFDSIERLEGLRVLDRPAATVSGAWRRLLPSHVKDLLHGVFSGHPLHPVLITLPIGTWAGAAYLDLRPGGERAARTLVGLGLVSAVPTAAAGITDWSEMRPDQQRVGAVHALVNIAALGLYAGSYLARVRGRTGWGRGLGLAGLGVVAVGGTIGGHLAYRQAGGVNHAEAASTALPDDWKRLGPLGDLPEGEPVGRQLGDVPLFLLRRGRAVDVLVDRCSHLGGPLHEGSLSRDGCITCPWHGSTFRLADGSVARGPATAPQPRLQVRLDGEDVWVRGPAPR